MSKETNVVAVNLWSRWALTEAGTCLYITDFYDEYGEDTSDPEQAVAGMCQCAEGWLTINFADFQEVESLH